MEVRYLAHAKQRQALELMPVLGGRVPQHLRPRERRARRTTTALDDAEIVVVALGSVLGTIKDTVDEMREQGVKIGVLGITCFRPWPARDGAQRARRREAHRGAREEPRRRHGRHRVEQRGQLVRRIARPRAHGDRRPRRSRDHARLAAQGVCAGRRGHARRADVPRPRSRDWSSACSPASANSGARDRSPRQSCAKLGVVAAKIG